MNRRELRAKFTDFDLPESMKSYDATAAIPVSKGLQQIWYFLNLRAGKGLTLKFPRRGILSFEALGFYLKKVYRWNIFGPASIHKYRVTADGPEKLGIFTHDEILRMTIHKVFLDRGKKLIACTGFPNNVFVVDAHSMDTVKRIEVYEKSGSASVVGSLYPSPDGRKIFVITTGSFQVIDVEAGVVEESLELGRIYDPFNHMISVRE